MQREIYKFITSFLESGLLIVTFKCDINIRRSSLNGTAMQTEKALINDRLHVLKVY